jgi:hypothetical protein
MVSKTTKWSLYAWPGAEPERLDPPVMAVGGLACMRGHLLEQHIQHGSTILYSIKHTTIRFFDPNQCLGCSELRS